MEKLIKNKKFWQIIWIKANKIDNLNGKFYNDVPRIIYFNDILIID